MAASTIAVQAVRRARLKSALRTALACSIVGLITLYAPAHVRKFLAYPAFSYVTTILIVSDATVGDALRGVWNAFYATTQVMLFSVLSLWLAGPARFATHGVAAAAVSLGAFLVALPESTHLMSKRIAFGQMVIIFVGAAIGGANTGVVTHPVHVASSTALGALASVLALLFPYPWLACSEIRKTCRLYAENASERLNLYLDGFFAKGRPAAVDLISQAACFSRVAKKLLQNIKEHERGVSWERPGLGFLNPNYVNLGKRLREIELPLRGMEMALNSCSSFPIGMADQELQKASPKIKLHLRQKLEQARCFAPCDATTAPETKGDDIEKALRPFTTIPASVEDLPALFFLHCVQILQHDLIFRQTLKPVGFKSHDSVAQQSGEKNQAKYCFGRRRTRLNVKPSCQSLIFALKCSLSLGLAVLFGLIYNKENGYWAGLTIAISFAAGRQPTFTVANARAQGTAMGSVYGLLGYFICGRSVHLRFLPLLPWIIFTSLLRHSRMYGQAGGISAVIGALLILGRRDYGPPTQFAIARITEASIGLICFIMVELLCEPARASTLAKVELSTSLRKLGECIEGIVLCLEEKQWPDSRFHTFQEKLRDLRTRTSIYGVLTEEAVSEPNFWFLPFPGDCYLKILECLSKMVDLIQFTSFQLESLQRLSLGIGVAWKEIQEPLEQDLELFKEMMGTSIQFLGAVTSFKSLSAIDTELQKTRMAWDIELGKSQSGNLTLFSGTDDKDVAKVTSSFLRRSNEVVTRIHAQEGLEELKSQIVLCIGGLSFCLSRLMRETMIMEEMVKELLQRENPTRLVNISEIYSKLKALNM
ncbi:uncharacterized protein LOC115749720 [Rhodamnia argentea]|uniref:Uncharacterized protein LOC115749720 n=1 Tax=Rhodamnia argentea TaxID=178133 RepID=A0A8B8Q892_9MYRT|nr:uncharacterized protein LOC115749720 [Rhodamnia argentea]